KVVAIAGQSQEKILQRKVMEYDHSGTNLHRIQHSSVVTMVIAHVIQHRIEFHQLLEVRTLSSIIQHLKPRNDVAIHGLKTIHEQCDIRAAREIRQELLAVVSDA